MKLYMVSVTRRVEYLAWALDKDAAESFADEALIDGCDADTTVRTTAIKGRPDLPGSWLGLDPVYHLSDDKVEITVDQALEMLAEGGIG